MFKVKKLNKFQKFDLGAFLKGKKLEVANIAEHKKYVDGQPGDVDGVSIKVAIVSDPTDYGQPGVSNLYQMFTVRINGARLDDVVGMMKPGDSVQLVQYVKASIYGQFRDQLSVQVSSINDLKVLK